MTSATLGTNRMRISSIGYCLKQGMKNIWRNKMFSLASIATMSACIFLFGIFFCVVENFQYMVREAEKSVAVTVFFDEGLSDEEIQAILFRETTTIGVRRYRVERTALPRRFFEVRVPGGTVRIKACEQPDGAEKCYPEYEDVKRIARETGKSYREIYESAKTAAEKS